MRYLEIFGYFSFWIIVLGHAIFLTILTKPFYFVNFFVFSLGVFMAYMLLYSFAWSLMSIENKIRKKKVINEH